MGIRTHKHFLPGLWLVVLALMLPYAPLRAEDTAATGQVTAPEPAQQPQNQDRGNKNGAAKAIAMAGAAMAMVNCLRMQQKARETEDPQQKQMYEMMAMMQCQQAMQSAADAAKNGENQDKLTKDSTPKQSQLTPAKLETPKPPEDTKIAANPTVAPAAETTSEFEPTATEAPESVAAQPTPTDPSKVNPAERVAPGDDRSTLAAIPENGLKFDEASKGGGTTPTTPNGNGPMSPLSFFSRSPAGDDATKLAQAANDKNSKRKRTQEEEAAEGGGAGSESSGKSESGDDPFRAMLDKMMGGNPAEGVDASGMNGSTELLNMPEGKPGDPSSRANIFQYAAYRYKSASRSEGRLRIIANGKRSANAGTNDSVVIANSQDSRAH